MRVVDQINKSEKTLFSIEIVPPLKGHDINRIYNIVDPLIEYNPSFINVTYHKDEVLYKNLSDGSIEKRTIRKRPGTVALSAALKNKYNINVVSHLTCGGFTKNETENALIDLSFLGIDNLFVIRGDAGPNEKSFTPEDGGHAHAIDLVKQIKNMNNGKYLYDELEDSMHTNFSIGVAGYPEKHAEAPNIETDLEYLKQKVDAGADYIITQMFFDNEKYFQFVEFCRKKGINVPIIPGLKPIALLNQVNVLPRIFHIELPEALVKEVNKCKSNKEVTQVGIEWTINQSKELIKHNVPVLHYYTLGAGKGIQKIVKALF
ncbi:MAG: methylenetetrahydrofolate reductase [NAD(P)H] [Bacteroidetes bacterium]|nr:MAG: methylenetetrahydrofolate reductase [NAD(P)H] [Bacteroidota bacterium]